MRSPLRHKWADYGLALGIFIAVSALNSWLQRWFGYQALALVYLLAVVVLALFVGRGAILFGTALTALGWNFLFTPPRYSFHIGSTYDKMMFATYFAVALTVGQLTARLRAQRDAELKSRLLAESEKMGRTLLNSVSHELRTPIAAITSASSSLRASRGLTDAQENLAAEIESAALRLNRVVQSLLSAARLQTGHLRPKLDWCDLSDVVRVAVREAGSLLAGHPLERRLPDHLPLVKADFVLMEQALSNLLVNAATHTPAGAPIEIELRIDRDVMLVEVRDRGPGLAVEPVERIFESFQRPVNSKPGGAGLGLAIVKGFVEAQGGEVRAANRVGGGAIFTIRLPMAEAPAIPEEAI